MMVGGACLAGPASGQMGAFGPGGTPAQHAAGLKDGWLKTFGSSQGQADFATECAAAGYGLVAMGGEYRGTLLDQSGATVAPTSASSGQTYFPAAFAAAAEPDGTNFWSRGMVGEATGGLRGSARTNAVAFAHPDAIATATLFAGGWYQNKVEFDTVGSGLEKTAVGTSIKDCFIAAFDVDGDDINWVKTFPSVTSTANDEIFGLAASPEFVVKPVPDPGDYWPGEMDLSEDPQTGDPPAGTDPEAIGVSVVAVCGGFRGTIDFDESDPGGARETSAGAEDGFLVLLDQTTGDYIAHLTFGSSSGDDRAFAVVVSNDPGAGPGTNPGHRPDQVFYVCGYYSDDAVFPGIGGTPPSAVGRDMFVARAILRDDQGSLLFEFDRLYTFGTGDNDVARSIAVDPIKYWDATAGGGDNYARVAITGWTGGGSTSGRDLVVGMLRDYSTFLASEKEFEVAWQHELTGNDETDDAGLGVAIDPLGRVTVVGQYGVERLGSGSAVTESASFNPLGGDDKTTAGGWDGFLARYSVDGTYLDAAIYGHNYNDWLTAVVIDRGSGQIHMPGVFGHPNAPSTYNVGFGTSLPGSGRGGADMFWLSLLRDDPASLDAMVSIIVDGSGSMDDKWDDVEASLERIFSEEPFTVRRNGSIAINVVTFSIGQMEAVPWTVVDETSIDSITAILADLSRFAGGTGLWHGIDFALTTFEATPLESITDDAHKIMIVIGDGCNNLGGGGIDRSSVLSRMQTLGWPAEVAGVPIGTFGENCGSLTVPEYYEQEIVTLSQASGAMELVYPATAASDPSDPDHFEYQFRGIFKALTCCRADFDGDGEHVFLDDYYAFGDLYTAEHPAADLDFDGLWTSNDFTVFQDYASEPCPCGL